MRYIGRDELANRIAGRDDFAMLDMTEGELARAQTSHTRQRGNEPPLRETSTVTGDEVRSHMHKSVHNLDANLVQLDEPEDAPTAAAAQTPSQRS